LKHALACVTSRTTICMYAVVHSCSQPPRTSQRHRVHESIRRAYVYVQCAIIYVFFAGYAYCEGERDVYSSSTVTYSATHFAQHSAAARRTRDRQSPRALPLGQAGLQETFKRHRDTMMGTQLTYCTYKHESAVNNMSAGVCGNTAPSAGRDDLTDLASVCVVVQLLSESVKWCTCPAGVHTCVSGWCVLECAKRVIG
jgi:hypothetical protein